MINLAWWGWGLVSVAGLCLLTAGYFLGWRAGHLTGVRYMLDWEQRQASAEVDDLIAAYTWDIAQQLTANGKQQNTVYAEFQRQYNEHYGLKH